MNLNQRPKYLVDAHSIGDIEITEKAKQFINGCAKLIIKTLLGQKRQFHLKSYHHDGYEYLSMDWWDETGANIGFTIGYGSVRDENGQYHHYINFPKEEEKWCKELIIVPDDMDAFQICLAIAKLVPNAQMVLLN